MSYNRSKQLSGKEKKLQRLRMQLYGNEQSPVKAYSLPKTSSTTQTNQKTTSFTTSKLISSTILTEDFLRHDLLRSLFLAALAIAIQILLYLAIQRGMLSF